MIKFEQYCLQEEGMKHALLGGLMAGAMALTPMVHAKHKIQPPRHPIQNLDTTMNDDVITATLIGEAGGEGIKGMQAVLNVILNRAKGDLNKGSEICLAPKQFSLWNGKKDNINIYIDKAKHHALWSSAMALVQKAKQKQLPDITGGASFYFNPKLAKPSWAKSMTKTTTIGNHEFFKVS